MLGVGLSSALVLSLSLSQTAKAQGQTHQITLDITSTEIAPDQFPKVYVDFKSLTISNVYTYISLH